MLRFLVGFVSRQLVDLKEKMVKQPSPSPGFRAPWVLVSILSVGHQPGVCGLYVACGAGLLASNTCGW